MEFTNNWFYDVLRFCNDTYSLCNDEEYLMKHIKDILNGKDIPSSNEIANAYILKKCRIILDMIEYGDREEDISIYTSILRREWSDIVLFYNKNKRGNNNA